MDIIEIRSEGLFCRREKDLQERGCSSWEVRRSRKKSCPEKSEKR